MPPRKPHPLWGVVCVLPNLVIPGHREPAPDPTNLVERGMTLATRSLAIVPPTDRRVTACMERVPAARKLVEGFQDETGRAISPCVLITRSGARLSGNAINAFRTAVAMSCVLRARAAFVANAAHTEPSWSDHFDLHPTQVNRQGRLTTYSPALVSFHSPAAPFVGSPSPYVSHNLASLYIGTYLYRVLALEWKRLYGSRRGAGGTDPRVVFRALEVAYLAAATPGKLGGSANEWGVSVALWVSAIEILAYAAAGAQRASHGTVHASLATFKWSPSGKGLWSALDSRRYVVQLEKNLRVRSTAVQHAYERMYAARNTYLHGDPVTRSLLRPWGARVPSLPAVAPVVFRTALAAYLQRAYPYSAPDDPDRVMDYFNSDTYRQAVATVYDVRKRRSRYLD